MFIVSYLQYKYKPRNSTSNGLKMRNCRKLRWEDKRPKSVNGRAKNNLMAFEQNQSKNDLKSVSTLVTGSTNLFMERAGIALLKWHSS